MLERLFKYPLRSWVVYIFQCASKNQDYTTVKLILHLRTVTMYHADCATKNHYSTKSYNIQSSSYNLTKIKIIIQKSIIDHKILWLITKNIYILKVNKSKLDHE